MFKNFLLLILILFFLGCGSSVSTPPATNYSGTYNITMTLKHYIINDEGHFEWDGQTMTISGTLLITDPANTSYDRDVTVTMILDGDVINLSGEIRDYSIFSNQIARGMDIKGVTTDWEIFSGSFTDFVAPSIGSFGYSNFSGVAVNGASLWGAAIIGWGGDIYGVRVN